MPTDTRLKSLIRHMDTLKDPAKVKILSSFFKTGPGQYGEGDIFLGITVPTQRALAAKFYDLEIVDLKTLIGSQVHEHRLTALLILVQQYKKGSGVTKEKIAKFYLKNRRNVNNWDLVDSSAMRPMVFTFIASSSGVFSSGEQPFGCRDRETPCAICDEGPRFCRSSYHKAARRFERSQSL